MVKEKEKYPYFSYSYDKEAFALRRKSFYPLHSCKSVLSNLIPKLLHESDGLIFQDWEDSYVALTCEALLKWKYNHLNSVDFRLEVRGAKGKGEGGGEECTLVLARGGTPCPLHEETVVFPDNVDPKDLDSKIIECSYDQDLKKWIYLRQRTDKESPNDYNVFKKVLKSIQDNIGEEEIIEKTTEASRENPIYERDRNRTVEL